MKKFIAKLSIGLLLILITFSKAFSQRNANWEVLSYSSNIIKVIYHPFEYNKDFNDYVNFKNI